MPSFPEVLFSKPVPFEQLSRWLSPIARFAVRFTTAYRIDIVATALVNNGRVSEKMKPDQVSDLGQSIR